MVVNIKHSQEIKTNILNSISATWRDLVQATIEYYKGKATTDQIYEFLKKSKKAKNNNFIREKIRQVLNTNSNFYKLDNTWCLSIS